MHPETVARIERAMGALGTAAIAAMDERLPWFRKMSAENRSWLGLVAQAGIAAFADWIRHPERTRPAATEVFGTAPRELARAVSLQHAVEMVRVIIDVVEDQVDTLAAPGSEAELHEAVLIYAREIAFSAAQVYARTAEARGAWDARLEALVVDSLVRGEGAESLNSWASALNWSSSPVTVIVGTVDGDDAEPVIDELRAAARRARFDLIAGRAGRAADRGARRHQRPDGGRREAVRPVRGGAAGGRADGPGAAVGVAPRRGPRWPRCGRRRPGRRRRARSARTSCCPSARSTATRTRCGSWSRRCTSRCWPGGSALLDTLTAYLEQGSSLEASARMLFVHPNTVRYRLKRVTELTGYTVSEGRDGFTVWTAIILGRLASRRG